ncbi:MAG: hypothetical protein AABZ22_09160, partial [Nitrospirota bacterium]
MKLQPDPLKVILNGTMATTRFLATLTPLCKGVDEDIVRDFVQRMDPDYFDRFQPDEIARHIKLAGLLDPDHPCQVAVTDAPDRQLDIVVVAYDYFAEFATICGLLSSFGLDIREGGIYTFAERAEVAGPSPSLLYGPGFLRRRPRGKAGLARKKIVDVFRVRPMPGVSFTAAQQRLLAEELDSMVRL